MIRGRLYLLGEQALTPGPDPHAVPLDLQSASTRNLLAFLALHAARPLDRRQLAFLLWPDTTERNALRLLRQHLHRLRKLFEGLALPTGILTGKGGQLRFDPLAGLWIDVLAFEEQVTDRRRQVEAIELYRADLLVRNESEWVGPIRARLREQYLRALRMQIDAAKMQRNYPRALYYARRLLQAGPLQESAQRIHMEALYFDGKRVEALQQFEELERRLRREFGTRPMEETIRLYRQIRDGSLPRDLPLLVTSSRQVPQALQTITELGAAFVGRREELARLDGALAQALAGTGHFILVEGEGGLGKSSLLHSWERARAGQILSFSGRGEGGTTAPYESIAKLLRGRERQVNWEWFPPQFPNLASIRQLLASHPADAPSCTEGAGEGALALEQLGEWLLQLAARSPLPLVLLLDDLHQADEASCRLLTYLGHRCERAPLLVIGSCRRTALKEEVGSLLTSLERHRRLTRMRLWPFTRGETAALATHLLGRKPETLLLSRLYRETEGNPSYLVEFLHELRACPERARPALVAGHLLPGTVRSSINAEIGQLHEPSRARLAAAASIGRFFTFRALALRLPGVEEKELLDCLESWLGAGLVRAHADGYEFSHRLIHHVVRERGIKQRSAPPH